MNLRSPSLIHWQIVFLSTLMMVTLNLGLVAVFEDWPLPRLLGDLAFIGCFAVLQVLIFSHRLFVGPEARRALSAHRKSALVYGVAYNEEFKFDGYHDRVGRDYYLKLLVFVLLVPVIVFIEFRGWSDFVSSRSFLAGLSGVLFLFAMTPGFFWGPLLASMLHVLLIGGRNFGFNGVDFLWVSLFLVGEILYFLWAQGLSSELATLSQTQKFRIDKALGGEWLGAFVKTGVAAFVVFALFPESLSLKPTPKNADEHWILGLRQEVGGMLGRTLKLPGYQRQDTQNQHGVSSPQMIRKQTTEALLNDQIESQPKPQQIPISTTTPTATPTQEVKKAPIKAEATGRIPEPTLQNLSLPVSPGSESTAGALPENLDAVSKLPPGSQDLKPYIESLKKTLEVAGNQNSKIKIEPLGSSDPVGKAKNQTGQTKKGKPKMEESTNPIAPVAVEPKSSAFGSLSQQEQQKLLETLETLQKRDHQEVTEEVLRLWTKVSAEPQLKELSNRFKAELQNVETRAELAKNSVRLDPGLSLKKPESDVLGERSAQSQDQKIDPSKNQDTPPQPQSEIEFKAPTHFSDQLPAVLPPLSWFLLVFMLYYRSRQSPQVPRQIQRRNVAQSGKQVQNFQESYEQVVVRKSVTPEEVRTLVIDLYNVLLGHFHGLGMGKEPGMTPSEYLKTRLKIDSQHEIEMNLVTKLFSRVLYAGYHPKPAEFKSYIESVRRLGLAFDQQIQFEDSEESPSTRIAS